MGLTGRIDDLPIVDLFQYLSAGKKDGTCILKEKEEKAYVYFHEGNVVHAVSPHRINIGDILIKAKKIDLKTLQKALISQSQSEDRKTIGQILVDMGAINQTQLKVAVQMQLKEVVQYLVTWKKGEFTFENNEIIPVDDINLNPAAVIPKSSKYTTTQLLMEAVSRLHDEAEKGSGGTPEPVNVPSPFEEEAMNSAETSVSLEPEEGQGNGTEVSADDSVSAPTKGSSNGDTQVGKTEKGAAPGEKGQMLILTGDGVFKNLLRERFQKKKFSVAATSTVEDGLDRVKNFMKKEESLIVVCDHKLTGNSRVRDDAGIRFLTAREASGKKFSVIIMMDSDDPETAEDLYRAGAQGVLTKPERGSGGDSDFPSAVKKFCGVVEDLIQKRLSSSSAH